MIQIMQDCIQIIITVYKIMFGVFTIQAILVSGIVEFKCMADFDL